MDLFKRVWERINRKPWEKFNRFRTGEFHDFYGCVDSNGEWFDSALSFRAAVQHVAQYCGQHDLTFEQEIDLMCGSRLKGAIVELEDRKGTGCSIIHSSMLRKMHEAGLLT